MISSWIRGWKLPSSAVRKARTSMLCAAGVPLSQKFYSALSDSDVSFFRNVLDENGVVSDQCEMESFNCDWLRKYRGSSSLALLPKTAQQVSELLKYCNSRSIAVVPQGGNTGLVGGSVPVSTEVVLSTVRMNRIISLDTASGVLSCEAGCILENLEKFVEEEGFCMPLDLGAKGSCTIGGNLSTNAGGLRYVRYGSLRGSVLGVESVLSDGTVLDLMNQNCKDNTGYDLKQLFIGSEGTLGVITKVAMKLPRKPTTQNVAIMNCSDFASVIELCTQAKITLGETLSAVELMDHVSIRLVEEKCANVRVHFECKEGSFAVLLESTGSNESHDSDKLNHLLEISFARKLCFDGVIAQDLNQVRELWSIREHVPIATSLVGYQHKYDISVPLNSFYAMVDRVRFKLEAEGFADDVEVAGYGHLGDGNLHINVACRRNHDKILHCLEPHIFEWVAEMRGSISAEHGIGQHKRRYLTLQKGRSAVQLMHGIKGIFDPKGILNPFKVLPDEYE